MNDPWNPTDDEIIHWAYDAESLHEQDWDLAITEISRASLFMRLAADASCPTRQFFLQCLYLLVGDAVRGKREDERQFFGPY
jgi:hypothetical protein